MVAIISKGIFCTHALRIKYTGTVLVPIHITVLHPCVLECGAHLVCFPVAHFGERTIPHDSTDW